MICSGLNAFLTIDYPLFLIRQSNTRTGSAFGGQVSLTRPKSSLGIMAS